MLSRLVIAFLPRSKQLLISWLQSPSAVILKPKKIKSGTLSTVSSSISHKTWCTPFPIWNQSILKEISPEYSLEGLILKLKLQYFCIQYWCEELTHWKRPWCWERSRAAGEGDDRGWDGWRASLTQWTWAWASSGSWWRTGKPGMLQSMASLRVGYDWVTELNWLENSPLQV